MKAKAVKLSKKEIDGRMKKIPMWTLHGSGAKLSKVFHVPDFIAGLALAAKITVHAEMHEHHPTIELSYGKVTVKLSTDDRCGLSEKDFELAIVIDRLA